MTSRSENGTEGARRDAPLVVGLGELIWDLLPEGKQLGGAPSNFAYISGLLGNSPVVASRVGADDLGREALDQLDSRGVSTRYLQVDQTHPTGTVGVRIDGRGEAHFEVNCNSAWDYLEWTEEWKELAREADCVCFGTLGQREAQGRATIISFLEETRAGALRVFDVNLRHSFFTTEMLRRSLELATIVKLNREELLTAGHMLGLAGADALGLAREMLDLFELKMVAVTRGGEGSLLVSRTEASEHQGFQVRVRDTIGAGDAFAAALAHYYLRGYGLGAISEAANRMGSWVASQRGATPGADVQMLQGLLGELYGP